MSIIEALIQGIIQGLTEFLPVSSSGHLVLFGNLFKIEETLFVSIILHIATLLSVVIVFRKEIWNIVRHPFSREGLNLIIATIPTCLIALTVLPIAKLSFEGKFLAISFLISAVLLFFAEKKKNQCPFSGKQISSREALFMGIAQGLAIFPGISRSGATISAGLFAGVDKKESTRFSFVMSLPIILLSLFMEIFEITQTNVSIAVSPIGLMLAFILAFIVGILSIKLMVKLTTSSSLKYFSIYLVLIAIVSFIVL